MRTLAVAAALLFFLVVAEARAGCCRVVKVDPETPVVPTRVCEPDGSGGCGDVLFLGPLALGEEALVCSASDTIVYQEYDELLAEFSPPVEAVCEDGDVEL